MESVLLKKHNFCSTSCSCVKKRATYWTISLFFPNKRGFEKKATILATKNEAFDKKLFTAFTNSLCDLRSSAMHQKIHGSKSFNRGGAAALILYAMYTRILYSHYFLFVLINIRSLSLDLMSPLMVSFFLMQCFQWWSLQWMGKSLLKHVLYLLIGTL